MTGLETLGAVVSTAQIITYIGSIVSTIDTVRTQIRDGPSRIQQQDEQLTFLASLVESVRGISSLHTEQVATRLDIIAQKVDELHRILTKYLSDLQTKSPKRFLVAITALKAERQISQSLAVLECDKSSLLLHITKVNGSTLQSVHKLVSVMASGGQFNATDVQSSSSHEFVDQNTNQSKSLISRSNNQISRVSNPVFAPPAAPSSKPLYHSTAQDTNTSSQVPGNVSLEHRYKKVTMGGTNTTSQISTVTRQQGGIGGVVSKIECQEDVKVEGKSGNHTFGSYSESNRRLD